MLTSETQYQQFPNIALLLGGYFHPDWLQEFGHSDAAVEQFVTTNVRETRDAIPELDVLLLNLDADLDSVLDRFLCNYWPQADGISPRDWLTQLRDRFTTATSLA